MEKRYIVHEHFATFQGEGVHMGKAAYFVRLYGCDQKCHFCDSAGTWHPDYRPHDMPRLTAAEVAALVPDEFLMRHYRCPGMPGDSARPIVVVTGGEPTLYDVSTLALHIDERYCDLHIETAGHIDCDYSAVRWVTLSPKPFAKPPTERAIRRADEFKVIVERPESIAEALACLNAYGLFRSHGRPVWLHPEWGHRDDPAVLEAIVRAVADHPHMFRAGWQVHKLYRVDEHDPNCRPPVPLGGRP